MMPRLGKRSTLVTTVFAHLLILRDGKNDSLAKHTEAFFLSEIDDRIDGDLLSPFLRHRIIVPHVAKPWVRMINTASNCLMNARKGVIRPWKLESLTPGYIPFCWVSPRTQEWKDKSKLFSLDRGHASLTFLRRLFINR